MGEVTVAPAGAEELPELLALRFEVFCTEQGVSPEIELDGRDRQAVHLAARRDGKLVGSCRLLREDDAVLVGRVAVRAGERRGGVGALLMQAAERLARGWGARELHLHAQRASEKFYLAQGYRPEGDTFLEGGIEHVIMRRPLR